ncbi:granzyme M isoform X2 [Symphalangus syndactylus]|uniref:granzyme M isoform X2 n=1 Tax=Symphalangus syndactylus TaxID=9590 RepID=UPI003003D621
MLKGGGWRVCSGGRGCDCYLPNRKRVWGGLGLGPAPTPGLHSGMEACVSSLLVLALGVLSIGSSFETQIIGGREVMPHSRPYMASLQRDGSHLCGGVLVHPKWVLTAAHCLVQRMARLKLVLGLHTLDDPGLTFHIKAAVQHPHYKPVPALENDLALLQLDGKVKPSRTIRPLALPSKRQVVAAGTRCSMAGWGLTHQGGPLSRVLRELDLHVLDTRMCNNSRFWNGSLSPHMVCLAADSKDQAPCKGDSGGPLVCGKGQVLAGVLSFSSRVCTNIFKPPVATAVAPYVSWIRKVTGRSA